MKTARATIPAQVRSIPELKFADQQMTSYGGLVVFQHLFERLGFFSELQGCCAHLKSKHLYSYATVVRVLIVHLLIGCQHLREMDFYRNDPMVLRCQERSKYAASRVVLFEDGIGTSRDATPFSVTSVELRRIVCGSGFACHCGSERL